MGPKAQAGFYRPRAQGIPTASSAEMPGKGPSAVSSEVAPGSCQGGVNPPKGNLHRL